MGTSAMKRTIVFNSITAINIIDPRLRRYKVAVKTMLFADTCPITPFLSPSTYTYQDGNSIIYNTTIWYSVEPNSGNILRFNYTTSNVLKY
uniref:Uncharacterized protein n=1 Tax=Caenorhabditis japonica TaxID=281687 RepID=A0A8R1EQR8_CAEJA